jgi:hypothetical protein
MQENRQKPIEESLPRNPEEGRTMPDAGLQINRVVVLETGNNLHFDTPPKFIPQPVDDARRG